MPYFFGMESSGSLPPFADLRRIRPPADYFAATRTSRDFGLRNILCFTRQNRKQTASQPLSRHHHHRYVLVAPWEGTGTAFADDRRFSLRPHEALLIFPFQFHHGFGFDQARVLWLFITFEAANGEVLDPLRMHPLRKLAAGDFSLLSEFVGAWLSKQRRNELSHWLALFLDRMLRAAPADRIEPRSGHEPPGGGSSLLARINHCCLPALDRPLGLKQVAQDLGISESHLRARFRSETGISLGQHLRRLRLQKAMGLLLQSNLSVTVIAERSGFDSVYSFSRAFARFTGMTATAYRKRYAER